VQSRPRVQSTILVSLALVCAACAGSAEPLAENHACFRALDCQEGLVCVEGRCTADISPIVPEGAGAPADPDPDPEAAPDAG
jgi:hypothetical protein